MILSPWTKNLRHVDQKDHSSRLGRTRIGFEDKFVSVVTRSLPFASCAGQIRVFARRLRFRGFNSTMLQSVLPTVLISKPPAYLLGEGSMQNPWSFGDRQKTMQILVAY